MVGEGRPSKEVLAGIKTRNEARAEQGLAGLPDGASLLVPINMETTDQAQQRSDHADAESAASIAAQETPPAPSSERAKVFVIEGRKAEPETPPEPAEAAE
jgi:hypothetical protein